MPQSICSTRVTVHRKVPRLPGSDWTSLRFRRRRQCNAWSLKGLAHPAIAFPLDVGHLARCNISFEWAEATDAGFPSLQGNFVVAGRQRDSKSALLIRDERGHLPIILFHRKVAFASGVEAAASILLGPGLAGLMVITPSIPDSPAEGVWPVEAQTAMTMSPQTVSKLRELTAHYIRACFVVVNNSNTK